MRRESSDDELDLVRSCWRDEMEMNRVYRRATVGLLATRHRLVAEYDALVAATMARLPELRLSSSDEDSIRPLP